MAQAVKHISLSLQVNGAQRLMACEPSTLLVDALRDGLHLTGTHIGCDTAQCGACTVLIDGAAVKSCNVLALQMQSREIRTIESVGTPELLHVMQQAFSTHHALQCGYCTPGLIMRALAMHREGVPPEPQAVREALMGHICRCTGYAGIVAAICEGLTKMRAVECEALG
jgi:aerobic carbon-monoxide dehydrogenase small subunit